jgi:hypothetical protein
MNSYAAKLLRATLTLPEANFPGTSSNTLTLTGYRMLATVTGAANYPYSLDLTIFGMREEDMNAVTILWSGATRTAINARALIQLEASGDGGDSWTQVFEGTFNEAMPDYRSVPYANLRASAFTGNGMQMLPAAPTSYPGSASVGEIAAYLAGKMDFALENNGVTGNLANPYFPGTYMNQFRALCQHANLDFYFDGNATLAICPKNSPRLNKPVPVLSPSSGLVGFPTIQRYGIHVDALFTPGITLGGTVQVAGSIVPSANGIWFAMKSEHVLESLEPGGAWFSSLELMPVPA